ncbi:myogenesis-regulating glycosidase-like [Mya arenaria]|uniref:myogenesis-regulating glycosidase-like n=1 Tax=Mya arenaria TaxID=6604 RepID=UPI0022E13372|nr:myogenesis-regulating glycosidase-like [Mya arenaria]
MIKTGSSSYDLTEVSLHDEHESPVVHAKDVRRLKFRFYAALGVAGVIILGLIIGVAVKGNGKGGGGGGGTTVTPSTTNMTSNPTSKPTSSKTANLGNLSVTWGSGVSFNIADKGQWSHKNANKSTPLLSPTNCSSTIAVICLEWADDRRLKVSRKNDITNEQNAPLSCYDVEWTALKCVGQVLTDCFNTSGAHWYGGYEDHDQHWPFEKNSMKETSYTGNDPFHPGVIGNILERYFVSSKGVGVYVDNDVPLYFSLNSPQNGLMCFSAKYEPYPYFNEDNIFPRLKYTVCSGENVKDTHVGMSNMFIPKPTGIPNQSVIKYPIWSTWAQYHYGVNQSNVLSYAHAIKEHNFTCSQVEIDDVWTPFYGDYDFDTKFHNASDMIQKIHDIEFNVSVWVHPFFDPRGESYKEAEQKHYLLRRFDSDFPEVTSWWNGNDSGILDVTNTNATKWYLDKMEYLKGHYKVDSFKFDAGSLSFAPHLYSAYNLTNNPCDIYPGLYVKMAAQSDHQNRQEVRSGYRSQQYPIFFRQIDKRSNWSHKNAFQSIIPSALTIGILGYPYVMADMVGGNAYEGSFPDTELFIRWTQLNTFLPVVQMSIGPWDLQNDTYEGHSVVDIVRRFIELHSEVADDIIAFAEESVQTGAPIIRPLWWIDPDNETALTCEDEFLVGDKWLVAPIMTQGARKRDIFFPSGEWTEVGTGNGTIYTGPSVWYNYIVEIDQLAYFRKTIHNSTTNATLF